MDKTTKPESKGKRHFRLKAGQLQADCEKLAVYGHALQSQLNQVHEFSKGFTLNPWKKLRIIKELTQTGAEHYDKTREKSPDIS